MPAQRRRALGGAARKMAVGALLIRRSTKREKLTTGSNNHLRAKGFIPAILYGGKESNLNISVSKKDLSNIINSETFLSKVLEIEVDGKKEKVWMLMATKSFCAQWYVKYKKNQFLKPQ